MSENRVIYEITQKMSDTSVMQNDMNEAAELVIQMFKDKYFNRLNSAISEHNARCLENPSKEVRLLHALKPFFPDEKSEKIDQLIQLMLFCDTADSVKKELKIDPPIKNTPAVKAAEASAEVESVHEDGVYDVDRTCLTRKCRSSADVSGLLFIMAILSSGSMGKIF